MAVETVFMDTFAGIIKRPNGKAFDLRWRQFASVSTAATMIAAGPPKNRNVRKTQASEKLIANFERGRARLMRGATKAENTKTHKKLKLIDSAGRLATDHPKQSMP